MYGNFMRKYYFMAGLPRCGNTVLSSILNQNPKIQVSANSFVSGILTYTLDREFDGFFTNFPDRQSLENFALGTFDLYYKSWKGDIIIDRGPWGTDGNLMCLNECCPNELKFICPIRGLPEILSSFILLFYKNGQVNLKDEKVIEHLCKKLFEKDNVLSKGLWSIRNLSKPEYKDRVYFMHYDDLCSSPQNEIDNIYDFLGVKKFKHDLNNIKQYEGNGVKYDDDSGSPHWRGLHDVRPLIHKAEYDIHDILPQSVIDTYNIDIFNDIP